MVETSASHLKIAIIGAGPAGISAAYELSKAGCQVDLFEASKSVGGLAQTIELWNQKVDLGPHRFFTQDQRVSRLWQEVLQDSFVEIPRMTRILYNQSFFQYPLQAADVLTNLSSRDLIHCLSSYGFRRKSAEAPAHLEEWLISKFGTRLYEIFFKGYTEKLWGLPCTEIDIDFAAQRIKGLNLSEVMKSALSSSTRKHRTLIQSFQYPKQGSGELYEKMKIQFLLRGNRLHFNSKVQRVESNQSGTSFRLVVDGQKTNEYDFVLSTMPLTDLVQSLNQDCSQILEHAGHLKFRSTILVYLHLDRNDVFPDNWIYVNSEKLKLGRITNFRNWSPELYGNERGSILCLEYWCQAGDSIWNQDDSQLIEMGKKELVQTGLCRADEISRGTVYRIGKSYPIYKRNYKEHLQPIQEFLKKFPHLLPMGRYGSFKYNNQDHSLLMGLLASEKILKKADHDLWSVNSDIETYQEAGTGPLPHAS